MSSKDCFKLYRVPVPEDKTYKCPGCNWEVESFVYMVADNKDYVIERMNKYLENPDIVFEDTEPVPLCSECMCDVLVEEDE